MSHIEHLFPGSNCSSGYISRFSSALSGLRYIYILKGGPGCGKSTLLRRAAQVLVQHGCDIELWPCASDSDSLDGVCAPRLSLAVIDGTAPHCVEPQYPGALEQLVDLGRCWDASLLRPHLPEIAALQQEAAEHYGRCTRILRQASAMREAEQSAARNSAERRYEQHFEPLCRRLWPDPPAPPQTPPPMAVKLQRELFASAITPQGRISYAEELSRRCTERILLIGPVGCGRERLIQALREQAAQRGERCDCFIDPLQPRQCELLLLPQRDTAILSADRLCGGIGTDDMLINCGSACPVQEQSAARISSMTEEAAACLREAADCHARLEAIYHQAIDFSLAEAEGDRLLSELRSLLGE